MKKPSLICLLLVPAIGCGSSVSAEHTGGLIVKVTAGPTCPVARVEDPACAPRRVRGARLLLAGSTDQTLVTDAAGIARSGQIMVGTYSVTPQAVPGLMGTAPPRQVVIRQGETTQLVVSYDTGIR